MLNGKLGSDSCQTWHLAASNKLRPSRSAHSQVTPSSWDFHAHYYFTAIKFQRSSVFSWNSFSLNVWRFLSSCEITHELQDVYWLYIQTLLELTLTPLWTNGCRSALPLEPFPSTARNSSLLSTKCSSVTFLWGMHRNVGSFHAIPVFRPYFSVNMKTEWMNSLALHKLQVCFVLQLRDAFMLTTIKTELLTRMTLSGSYLCFILFILFCISVLSQITCFLY